MFEGRTLALLGALCLLATPAASAATVNETVQTPAGTYHVLVDTATDEPDVGIDWFDLICFGDQIDFCVSVPVPNVNPGGAWAHVALYEETNGCDGLQTASGDCDGDGATEPSDDPVVDETVTV